MMDTRDFLNSVIALAGDNVEGELVKTLMVEKATAMLVALDRKNGKRAETEKAKRAEANAPLLANLVEYMTTHGDTIASDIATVLGVSTSKATALAKSLVAEGKATVRDVKVKGKGTVKGYSLVRYEDTNGEVQALDRELSV